MRSCLQALIKSLAEQSSKTRPISDFLCLEEHLGTLRHLPSRADITVHSSLSAALLLKNNLWNVGDRPVRSGQIIIIILY